MTTQTTPNVYRSRLPLGLALLCFAVLGGSYVVNSMDRQVFAMVLPFVMKEYGFNLQTGGLLVSIFTLGIGLAGIPAGYLLERLSRKSVMMIAIAVYSVFTILTAYAVGFSDMFLYRTVTGFGEGMQMAALYTAVGAYFPKFRALVFALLSAMFGIGNSISPLIAGHLLEANNWRLLLMIFGVLGFVFVLMIAFVSKDFTEHQETRGETEIEADLSRERVWSRDLVLAAIAAVAFGLSQFAFLGIYPTFLGKMLHMSPSSIGFIMSMFGLGALVAVPVAFLGDKLGQKWIVLGALAGIGLMGYLAFNVAVTPTYHAVLTLLVGFFGGTFIANMSSLMQRCVPAIHIGKASGIYVTSVFLPASFSGYVFGVLIGSVGWGAAALVQLGIVPAIGATALLFMSNRRHLEGSASALHGASVGTAETLGPERLRAAPTI